MNLYNRAFSIAEMMIVMLILSIILAAATPIITHRVVASSTSSSDSSLPTGVIVIWQGSVATIPDGWHLCDGTNGTPDLRSRFVYGAGGDTSSKTSWANGWNITNGHSQVGYVGGEEQHILTIDEMPSHTHAGTKIGRYMPAAGDIRDYHSDGSITTGSTGGNLPHNILPRFIVLAYIMKL